MKKYIGIVLVILFGMSHTMSATNKVHVEKFAWYKLLRNSKTDTTYVLNFWATWCMPCIEELPVFEDINKKFTNEKVKVILVSLDHIKKMDITLQPYIDKKGITTEVVLLNEPDFNSWIDLVDKKWEGSIPCTVIFNTSKKFYQLIERQVSEQELEEIIQSLK
ncbi:MAG: TlpA family protein disulfide reductase [Bacteroidetes bacterium]|nr:TlpA family protein disulfide reductase [Bacteroidota bacterium]